MKEPHQILATPHTADKQTDRNDTGIAYF